MKSPIFEKWEWYNGCSWWRLGIAGDQARHAEVLYPTIDRDGHPNLVCSEEVRRAIAALPELVEAARRIVAGDHQSLPNYRRQEIAEVRRILARIDGSEG